MMLSLHQIAQLVGGARNGDPSLQITGADTLREATSQQISFADSAISADELAASAAAAVIVSGKQVPRGKAYIVVDNPRRAFALVVTQFRPQWKPEHSGISSQAYVSPTARVHSTAQVHPLAYVGNGVTIGPHTVVHAGVRIMPGCKVGAHCTLFPNAVLYENTDVGNRCLIHAGAVLGAYGFGYHMEAGQHQLCAQLGNVRIADDVEIGAGSTVDRGSYGSTVIGSGTKLDDQVMIGHNCRIGRHNLLCAQVGVAGSCTTDDYVVMAGQAGLRDHIHVGQGAVVGGQAGVKSSIAPGERVLGTPAVTEREFAQTLVNQQQLPKLRKQIKQLIKQVAELEAELERRDRSAAA